MLLGFPHGHNHCFAGVELLQEFIFPRPSDCVTESRQTLVTFPLDKGLVARICSLLVPIIPILLAPFG